MHNVWLIAKREYLERVRTKAFLISTILIPVLMGGGIVASIISGGKAKSTSHITIVSKDQQLATDLQTELQNGKDSRMTVDVISPGNSETRKTLDAMLADKQLDGYLWITPASTPNGRPAFAYTPRSTADIATKGAIRSALRTVLMRERLSHEGMVASDVDSLMQPVDVDTTQAGKNARHDLQLRCHLRPLLPHVHGHPALRHERCAFDHRGEDLPRLRGTARHHPPRRDDGRQSDRCRLSRAYAGRRLACHRRRSRPAPPSSRPSLAAVCMSR